MRVRVATIALAASIVGAAGAAYASPPTVVDLGGGPGGASAVRRAVGDAEIVPEPPRLRQAVALGAPAPGVEACPAALAAARALPGAFGRRGEADPLGATLAWAGDRLLNLDPPGALEAVGRARTLVPCVPGVVSPGQAQDLFLLEAVARAYGGEDPRGPAMDAAAGIAGGPGPAGRFNPEIAAAFEEARGALAPAAPVAGEGGLGRLYFDGAPAAEGRGLTPGPHLAQLAPEGGGPIRSALVTVPAGGPWDPAEALGVRPPGALAAALARACDGAGLPEGLASDVEGWLAGEGAPEVILLFQTSSGEPALWRVGLRGGSEALSGCPRAPRGGAGLAAGVGVQARAVFVGGDGRSAPRGSGVGYTAALRLERGRLGLGASVGVMPHPLGPCEGCDVWALSGAPEIYGQITAGPGVVRGRWRAQPSLGVRGMALPDLVSADAGGVSVSTRVLGGPVAQLDVSRALGGPRAPAALGLSASAAALLGPGDGAGPWVAWPLELGAFFEARR